LLSLSISTLLKSNSTSAKYSSVGFLTEIDAISFALNLVLPILIAGVLPPVEVITLALAPALT